MKQDERPKKQPANKQAIRLEASRPTTTRTNKLVGDEFRMLDMSTTNCSDVVSNYSSEIPSNSATAINNVATNQGSYIYTMRSGKTRS